MMVSNRNLLFQGLIFRFHVKLLGCNTPKKASEKTKFPQATSKPPTSASSSRVGGKGFSMISPSQGALTESQPGPQKRSPFYGVLPQVDESRGEASETLEFQDFCWVKSLRDF